MATTAYVSHVTISPIIGRTRIAARVPVPGAAVAVSRVMGAVKPWLHGMPEVRCAVRSVIGRARIKGYVDADDRTTAGFPIPNQAGYEFSRRSGVQRTTMRSGRVRQRRRWADGHGAMSIQVDIPLAKLDKFEADVSRYGYDWFTMPLITGACSANVPEPHTVRITGDISLGSLHGDTIRVTLPIEYQTSAAAAGTTLQMTGADAAAKATAGTLRAGGTLAQTVFPLTVKAVDAYPGTAISREFYMAMASAKAVSGTLLVSTGGQSVTQDTKAIAGTLRTGGTLVAGTYRNIENGAGLYHLDPLETAAKATAGLFFGGSLLNYVNVDNIIVSVPDGSHNYFGTQDAQATAGSLRVGGTLVKDSTGILSILIADGGVGTFYTGAQEAKAVAGTLRTGGTYVQDPVPGALVVNIEDEGAGTFYTGPAGARTWAGNFNGGTFLNTDNTLPSVSDGGSYFGTADTKATAGTLRTGGTFVNTDTTLAATDDGGSYTGAQEARTWAGTNFGGGTLTNP